MRDNNLTGDFITDHPFVSLGLGALLFGLVRAVSDISSRDKYEIKQMEDYKQAKRNELMRQDPYVAPDLYNEMLRFFLNGSNEIPEGENRITYIRDKWNERHQGFLDRPYFVNPNLPVREQTRILQSIWQNSTRYKSIVDQSWKSYLARIEETLILRGWK